MEQDWYKWVNICGKAYSKTLRSYMEPCKASCGCEIQDWQHTAANADKYSFNSAPPDNGGFFTNAQNRGAAVYHHWPYQTFAMHTPPHTYGDEARDCRFSLQSLSFVGGLGILLFIPAYIDLRWYGWLGVDMQRNMESFQILECSSTWSLSRLSLPVIVKVLPAPVWP